MIDVDLRELDDIVSSCERLFSSPIPPNMARHGMRSPLLWLVGLPFMLAGQLPWLSVVLCVATTAYIYLGIDELGVLLAICLDPWWGNGCERPYEVVRG